MKEGKNKKLLNKTKPKDLKAFNKQVAQFKDGTVTITGTKILKTLKDNPYGLRASTLARLIRSPRRTVYNNLKSLELKALIGNIKHIWVLKNKKKELEKLLYKNKEKHCYFCEEKNIDKHHIINKKEGGTDEEINLINLCPNHHTLIHRFKSKLVYNNGYFYIKKDDGTYLKPRDNVIKRPNHSLSCTKNLHKKPSLYQVEPPKLTKTEKEILYHLTNQFLTPRQIAITREKSKRSIYFHLRNLRKKGIINCANKILHKIEGSPVPLTVPFKNQIRLHATELNIKIIYKGKKYDEVLSRSNLIYLEGNSIKLYSKSIEVYIKSSFFAETEFKAETKLMNYLSFLLKKIENQFDIIILKERTQNIKIVNQHFSHIENSLAKDYEKKGEWLKIYCKNDGKLWFLIDNSFNLHEAETVHPKTSKSDMRKVREIFDDIRDNDPPKLTKLNDNHSNLMEIVKIQSNNVQGLIETQEHLKANFKTHFKVLGDISKEVKNLGDGVNELRKEISKIKKD